ncbi:MAG: NADH-quinone oxidoreductase subunit A [Phycisphaerae bacterium]
MIDPVHPPEASAWPPFAPVLILIMLVATLAGVIMILAHVIGPRRHGPVKDGTYESAMPVIVDARRRFHVKFYIVAMLFLLFDVEVVFLWPWALLLRDTASSPPAAFGRRIIDDGFGRGFFLGEMAIFGAILLVGYVYAWRKGVFKWN